MSLPMHIKSPQIQRWFDEDLHRHMHVTLKQGSYSYRKTKYQPDTEVTGHGITVTRRLFLLHSYISKISFCTRILSLESQKKHDIRSKQKMKQYFGLTFSDRLGLAEQCRYNNCKILRALT
jgi:hypothetical protein